MKPSGQGARRLKIGRFMSICAMALTLPGCATRMPAAADRMASPPPQPQLSDAAWPACSHTPDPLVLKSGSEALSFECAGAFGRGLLYKLGPVASPPSTGQAIDVIIGTEDYPSLLRLGGRVRPGRDGNAASFLFAAQPTMPFAVPMPDGTVQEMSLVGEPTITVLDARLPASRSPRGTVILLTGLGGWASAERKLIETFTARGWVVITCSPALGTTRKRRFSVPGDERVSQSASGVAQEIDLTLAEEAYAIEAMLLYLAGDNPELPLDHLVAVGCSAGAINLPAVVARFPDRFDAAVLIGGGADVFRVITHSDLMGPQMRVQWGGRSPTAAQMKRLNEAVLERSALDPYHTAAFLAVMPVLQLQARFDRIVPASTGDVLYQRLGRPERWSYPLGHVGLFWWLPHEAGRIADWVDQATAPGRAGSVSAE